MTLSPPEMARRILCDLDQADFLWSFPVEDLLKDQRLQDAYTVSLEAESKMAGGAKPKAEPARGKQGRKDNGSSPPPDSRSPKGKGKGSSGSPKAPQPLWIWVLEIDAASTETLKMLWQQ